MHKENTKRKITYQKLFWLFIIGSLIGVVMEGIFCLVAFGHWETHVVSVWGPFCIIYGIGAAGLYACSVPLENKNILIRFAAYSLAATLVEYICGALLKYGLNMEAWNYNDNFLNIDGIISLKVALGWGLAGILFELILIPPLEKIFAKMQGRGWQITCIVLSVFMAVNLSLTAVCIARWAERHNEGTPAKNAFIEYIDEKYDDAYMKERFCEWKFLDK